MKTQIIALESHDDLISVRDRLSWAKTPRILLIWPKGQPVDLRPLDLRVLQRHADSLGAQLAIVTRGDSVRRQAEAIGLPVFESSAVAQREVWPAHPVRMRRQIRPPRRDLRERRGEAIPAEAPWRSNLLVRILAFAVGVLAVLALVAVFVPRASLTLYPESRTQSMTIPVSASADPASGLLAGSVPAREEKVVVSGSWSMPVGNHSLTLPLNPARGVVRFRNLTPTEIEIPAGTVVFSPAHPEIRFKTINLTHLSAGLDEIVEVPVEAVQPGSAGNLEAGSLQAIEGPLGLSAAVDNPEPTLGGSDRRVSGPNESDRAAILDQLTSRLLPEAETALQARLDPGLLLIDDTGQVSQVVEQNYDPPLGQAGSVLKLDARIEFSFRVLADKDLARLAESTLNSSLEPGFQPVSESLAYVQASVPRTDEAGVTRWQLRLERRALRSMDPARLADMVRGRSPQEAASILARSFQWDKPPQVTLTPAWWPWLPLLPFRTSVALH